MRLFTSELVKKYKARTVVNHVSIDVNQGEIVGLLGPNGAGKTTLFGPTGEILSEEHLNEAFGVEVRLYPLTLRNRTYTCVLPLGLKERMERGA